VATSARRPAVANASWKWPASPALEAALRALIDSGVFLATSAGNNGGTTCDLLPRKIEAAPAAHRTASCTPRGCSHTPRTLAGLADAVGRPDVCRVAN
jgi:hypothetical protein